VADFVGTERRDDGVALVELRNPPLNALSRAVLAELATAAGTVARDSTLKSVVIAGAGKAFAAGADIGEFDDDATARDIGEHFRRAFDAIAAIPRPVIAALHGVALGGGLELALACDLRIAAETARLGQPEILLGVVPGAGATQRLPRLIGPARAKELIWSGRQVKAEEALVIGLVDRVVPPDELRERALEWAAVFADGAVVAMGLAKRAIDVGIDRDLASGLDLEADAFAEVFETDDATIGVQSFREHGPGKARFTGR
jgi:enoyl-CoA hydratase/carnithine racemase